MNELDKVFGKNTDYKELAVSKDDIMSNLALSKKRFGTCEISEERMANVKNPEWRENERRLRREEDYIEFGGKPINESSIVGYKLFDVDQTYLKAVGLSEENMPHMVRPEFSNMFTMSGKGSINKTVANSRTITGFQKSISSIADNDKNKKLAIQNQFMQFLSTEGIDMSKLDDAMYKHMWKKFMNTKRVRLDVLADNMIREAEGKMAYEVMSQEDVPLEIINEMQRSQRMRRQMLRDIVKDHGPFIPIENLDIMQWYFDKYGFSESDRYYFENLNDRCWKWSDRRSIGQVFDEFQACIGYSFLEVYSYHLNKYREHEEKHIESIKKDDNNTELISTNATQYYVDNENIVDFDDELELMEQMNGGNNGQ